ncbi:MAG: transglutaminase domain-containing protein [Ruminococcaceae bacterium]|nr:transglutaminase domain-containing protein [Oscillospiraceae bacterium]
MKKIIAAAVLLCILLSGCSSWMNGSYAVVTPHTEPANHQGRPTNTISSYEQLRYVLVSMVEGGEESALLSVKYADEERIRPDMDKAVNEICQSNPYAVYAVEDIQYEMSSGTGPKTVSVRVTYRPNRAEMKRIKKASNAEQIEAIVSQQLDDCAAGVVLYVQNPVRIDYVQMVADYAWENPQQVMEAPEVSVSLYPEMGEKQIVELRFSYRSSREELRAMKEKVAPVFVSAEKYAATEQDEKEKAQKLYSFLMNRYKYMQQTSITPTYSLLMHGVGDSQAFAVVYAAMCRQVELNCKVVIGTRSGEPWAWNVMEIDGIFYHLDLLRCDGADGFKLYTKEEMTDYVWDYSIYPARAKEIS